MSHTFFPLSTILKKILKIRDDALCYVEKLGVGLSPTPSPSPEPTSFAICKDWKKKKTVNWKSLEGTRFPQGFLFCKEES